MSRLLLYPERQRCRGCRGYLTLLVIKGQYCSYPCAGMTDPASVPYAQWPRIHILSGRTFPPTAKRYYFTKAEALAAAAMNHKGAYVCDFCGHWHIGTSSGEKK